MSASESFVSYVYIALLYFPMHSSWLGLFRLAGTASGVSVPNQSSPIRRSYAGTRTSPQAPSTVPSTLVRPRMLQMILCLFSYVASPDSSLTPNQSATILQSKRPRDNTGHLYHVDYHLSSSTVLCTCLAAAAGRDIYNRIGAFIGAQH
ncbi:hypothetical protein F5Y08DRAFT_214008 [Xylaria arbuscula]|nr:hypothetical protein F5Y08DRAFT_214008 [Xylaria arbuscula]